MVHSETNIKMDPITGVCGLSINMGRSIRDTILQFLSNRKPPMESATQRIFNEWENECIRRRTEFFHEKHI